MPAVCPLFFLFSAQAGIGSTCLGFSLSVWSSCLPLIFARSFAQFFFPFRRTLPFSPHSFGINIAQRLTFARSFFALPFARSFPLFGQLLCCFALFCSIPLFFFGAHDHRDRPPDATQFYFLPVLICLPFAEPSIYALFFLFAAAQTDNILPITY